MGKWWPVAEICRELFEIVDTDVQASLVFENVLWRLCAIFVCGHMVFKILLTKTAGSHTGTLRAGNCPGEAYCGEMF